MTERLQEILNRKPSKWGNLTVKEFERDIKLIQERVEELERENKKLHLEIGKHASQIFDIANASFGTGERAKQLINKMLLKGESQ